MELNTDNSQPVLLAMIQYIKLHAFNFRCHFTQAVKKHVQVWNLKFRNNYHFKYTNIRVLLDDKRSVLLVAQCII